MTRLGIFIALVVVLPPAARAANGSVTGKVTAASGTGPFVVYVDKGPAEAAPPAAHREVLQRNSQFEPRSVWVHAGETVDFVNRDNIYHNVFSPTEGAAFDLGLYRGGLKKSVTMEKAGEVDVYCNIHPDMHAKVLVVPAGARVAEVGIQGSYTLADLPAGSYTLVAWSAWHEPQTAHVEVKAGQQARADFSLRPRAAPLAHLNKNGEQYGRYK